MEIPIFTTCSQVSSKQQALFHPFQEQDTNKTFQIISSLAPELKADQSLSHDGVCLTVESVTEHTYQVTAIAETLSKPAVSNGDREAGSIWKDVFRSMAVWTDIWFRVMWIPRQYAWIVRTMGEAGFFVLNSRNLSGT